MINLKKFKKKYCRLCGTQRCNPDDSKYLEGCNYWKELNNLLPPGPVRVFSVKNIVTSPYTDAKEFIITVKGKEYWLVKYSGRKDNNWKIDIYAAKGAKDNLDITIPDFCNLISSFTFKNKKEEDDFLDFLFGNFKDIVIGM